MEVRDCFSSVGIRNFMALMYLIIRVDRVDIGNVMALMYLVIRVDRVDSRNVMAYELAMGSWSVMTLMLQCYFLLCPVRCLFEGLTNLA